MNNVFLQLVRTIPKNAIERLILNLKLRRSFFHSRAPKTHIIQVGAEITKIVQFQEDFIEEEIDTQHFYNSSWICLNTGIYDLIWNGCIPHP